MNSLAGGSIRLEDQKLKTWRYLLPEEKRVGGMNLGGQGHGRRISWILPLAGLTVALILVLIGGRG